MDDVSWLLPLLAPLVSAANQRRYRQLELDEPTFVRSTQLIRSAVDEERPRPRSEICALLERHGISAKGQRAPFLLQRAALDGAVCLGPNRGRESTYIPLPALARRGTAVDGETGLAALAARYFTSHGPATVQDFAWWAGLSARTARAALSDADSLMHVTVGGTEMWAGRGPTEAASDVTHLLSPFDEYLLGYRDRSFALDPAFSKRVNAGGGMPKPVVLVGGRVVGVWKQGKKKGTVHVSLELFRQLSAGERRSVEEAVERFGRYLDSPAELGGEEIG